MPSVTVMFNNEEVMKKNLDNEVSIIGRAENCEIRIDNLGISRNHARIVREGEHCFAEDLGSSNGTFVNSKQIQRIELKPNDRITVGKYEIVFSDKKAATDGAKKLDSAPFMQDDILSTMQMDSSAIKKQLEEYAHKRETSVQSQNKQQSPDEIPSASRPTKIIPNEENTDNSKPPVEKLSPAEKNARDAELELLKKEMKTNKQIMLGAIIAAFIAIVVIIILLLSK